MRLGALKKMAKGCAGRWPAGLVPRSAVCGRRRRPSRSEPAHPKRRRKAECPLFLQLPRKTAASPFRLLSASPFQLPEQLRPRLDSTLRPRFDSISSGDRIYRVTCLLRQRSCPQERQKSDLLPRLATKDNISRAWHVLRAANAAYWNAKHIDSPLAINNIMLVNYDTPPPPSAQYPHPPGRGGHEGHGIHLGPNPRARSQSCERPTDHHHAKQCRPR
jgi:hypothetical protein